MSDNKKTFTAREAAQAVLAKTYELLSKSETLKKYETENRKAPPSVKYGKIETDQKPTERDYNEYNVKPGSFKDSTGKRLEEQKSPSTNPKEEAEGNNNVDGSEPYYQSKDKIRAQTAKENAEHMVKGEKLAKGDWKKIHDKLEREGYSKESADKIDGSIKAKLGKGENPDKDADAELGEKVEHDVEDHFKENADAEKQEGHDLMAKPDDKKEGETEHAAIPRLVGSAKLAKFMEYRHAKKKAQMAQQAAGQQSANAPAQGSTQAGHPDKSRPKTQPTKGNANKV